MRLSQKQNRNIITNIKLPAAKQLIPEILFALVLGYVVLFDGNTFKLFYLDKVFINTGLIVVTCLGWLTWRTINHLPFPHSRLDPAILAILGVYILATVFSHDSRRSLIVLPNLLSAILIFYLTIDLIRAGLPSHHIGWILFIITIPVVITGFAQLILWYRSWLAIAGLSDPIPPLAMRIPSTFGHPNILAGYMVLVLPIIITLAIRLGWTKSGIRIGYLVLFSFVILFFTSSRGGWLATAATLVILGLYFFVRLRSVIFRAFRKILQKPVYIVVLAVAGIALVILASKVAFWILDHPSHGSMFSLNREAIWGPAIAFFQAHPLVGYGPNLYGDMFLKFQSVPPLDPMPHAHSIIFAVVSETGMIGFVALLYLVVLLVNAFRKQWKATSVHDRWYLFGVFTALIGFSVHGQFDYFFDVPAIFVVVAILVAQLAVVKDPIAPERPSDETGQMQRILLIDLWKQIGLVAASGVLIACTVWNLYAYVPYVQGIDAGIKEDWKTAAESMDLSVQRDPLLAINWFQSGLAHSHLAINDDGGLLDSEELSSAIVRFETGLEMDPSDAVNWANLAALRWVAGDRGGAISAMTTASQRAPQAYIFHLTLGKWLETTGDSARAMEEYAQALSASPILADSVNFQETALRRDALTAWETRSAPAATTPFAQGWDYIQNNRIEEAVSFFEQSLDTKDMEAFIGLSEAYLQAGRLDEASKQLGKFFFVYPDNDWQVIHGILLLEKIAIRRGDQYSTNVCAETIANMLDTANGFGMGWKRSTIVSVRFYSRNSFKENLLPGIERVIITPELENAIAQQTSQAREP